MLKGIDISHYQKLVFESSPSFFKDMDFIICKASEGKAWTDKMFHTYAEFCLSNKILLGAYHYARPEYNTAEADANNFVSMVEKYVGKCLLALDWEQVAHNYDPAWALEWCNHVYDMTGVRPVVYCNAKKVARMKCFAGTEYGLWLAHWDNSTDVHDSCEPWKFAALKQYVVTDSIDRDVFYGNAEQFKKYQKSEQTISPQPEEPDDKDMVSVALSAALADPSIRVTLDELFKKVFEFYK